jgi:hypothetical protein
MPPSAGGISITQVVSMNAIYDEERVRNLMTWIDSHQPRPEPTLDNKDGTLTVATQCSSVEKGVFTERDVIPATMRAARELLGY